MSRTVAQGYAEHVESVAKQVGTAECPLCHTKSLYDALLCWPCYQAYWDGTCDCVVVGGIPMMRNLDCKVHIANNGQKCPTCHGLGEVHVMSSHDPADVTAYPCEDCGTTGVKTKQTENEDGKN